MGTGGSLSKRKSSSLKNKRSKNPSEVRRKKKNSGKYRTKKLRHQVDSDSDDSMSSVSYSSSSSEDDYRRRKPRSRSRTRKIVKGGKKRDETSSSSPESSRELPHSRKIKRSKKSVGSYKRKKTYKRIPRRDMSVSSTSSESLSDKTCKKKPWGGMSETSASSDSMSSGTNKKKLRRDMRVSSSSSDSLSCYSCSESEYERPRRRSKRKDRDKSNVGKLKNDNRSRYRSRSSSCSKQSNTSGYHSEERLMAETNSRRLRSVITFVKDPDEKDGSQLDRGGGEKIIHDYPFKSSDSIAEGKRREHSNHFQVESEKRRKVENNRDAGKFNLSRKNECDEDCAVVGCLNADYLESILRKKALENFRKFRGTSHKYMKPSAQEKDLSGHDVRQFPHSNTELVGSKMPKKDGSNTAIGTNLVVKEAITHKTISPSDHVVVSCKPKESMNATTASVIAKTGVNSTYASQNVNKQWVRHNEVKSMTPKMDTVSPSETVHVSGSPIEKNLIADVIARNHVFSSIPKESTKAPTSVIAKTGMDSSHASKNASKLMVKLNEVKSLIPKKDTLSPVDTVTVSGNPKGNFTTGVIAKTGADSICPPQTERKIPVKGHVTQSRIPKDNLINTASVRTDKLESGTPSTSHTSPKAHSVTKSSMDKSLGTNNQGAEVNNTCDSFSTNPVLSHKLRGKESNGNELSAETKEASRFEQKTMSTMRGGERVQVSYKVYIPNKTPALARRQLKR